MSPILGAIDIHVKFSILPPMTNAPSRQRGSRELWINAAYEVLISDGIDAVKVMSLARKLNLTRTGFYWFFADLQELHSQMVTLWENKNTGNLVERCTRPATTIHEALFNLMDCWLDPNLFDARLDLAIRNWARVSPALQTQIAAADAARIAAVDQMFQRHGFTQKQAEVRSLTVIYTQIGYISMQVEEDPTDRLERVQEYVELFAGSPPNTPEVAGFLARHQGPRPA